MSFRGGLRAVWTSWINSRQENIPQTSNCSCLYLKAAVTRVSFQRIRKKNANGAQILCSFWLQPRVLWGHRLVHRWLWWNLWFVWTLFNSHTSSEQKVLNSRRYSYSSGLYKLNTLLVVQLCQGLDSTPCTAGWCTQCDCVSQLVYLSNINKVSSQYSFFYTHDVVAEAGTLSFQVGAKNKWAYL